MKRDFKEWLSTFRFDPSKVEMWIDDDGVFQCEVTDKLYKVTLWEIAILAIYSELRNNFWKVDINNLPVFKN